MKAKIKSILHALAPRQYDAIMTTRANRHGQRVMERCGVPAIAAAVVERYGSKVLTGPFEGMEYITESIGSSFVPKLIGSYECELHTVIGQILNRNYATVVDIGSAEGFYVVGLALRLPGRPAVHAFDISTEAQKLCRLLAEKNGIANLITISGFCDVAVLNRTLPDRPVQNGRSLIVCDCEGYETEILDPIAVPALANADILVELHDHLKPGATALIVNRFRGSHDITLIDTQERDPNRYPQIGFLTPEQQQVAVSEFRNGPQQWAFLSPNLSSKE